MKIAIVSSKKCASLIETVAGSFGYAKIIKETTLLSTLCALNEFDLIILDFEIGNDEFNGANIAELILGIKPVLCLDPRIWDDRRSYLFFGSVLEEQVSQRNVRAVEGLLGELQSTLDTIAARIEQK
ncbi:MAG: hypothetical protein UT50_C0013G0004 [Candidatus Moranbacteria bacterium GW2011_GWA2_39_41]|nr:MAG: hypothetical protein UT50_C0013G0004 [Candidatus Moranbacteria bacterium GW2011_GWA2_39_41]